jgi:hypothetical protein
LPSGLLEEALEQWQRLVENERPRLIERHNDPLSGDFLRTSLIKDWGHNHVSAGLYVRLRREVTASLKAGHYLVLFDQPPELFFRDYYKSFGLEKINGNLFNAGGRHRQGAMLVPIADGLETAEQLSFRPLFAVIGLYALNTPNDTSRYAYQRAAPNLLLKPLARAAQREFYKIFLSFRRGVRESEREMVEAGSKLMCDLPDEDRIFGREFLNVQSSGYEPPLSINLKANSIKWSIRMGAEHVVEVYDQILCTPQFSPDQIQRVSHATS